LFYVISDVKYIDNKQLGVSLLNGVVFKIFFLEPAVKWEPNKLSVLLRISNLGTNILFIGVVEKKKKKEILLQGSFKQRKIYLL